MPENRVANVGSSSSLDSTDTCCDSTAKHDFPFSRIFGESPDLDLPAHRSPISTPESTECSSTTAVRIEEPEGRRPPKIHIMFCIIKLILSFGIVVVLIVSYALSIHVSSIGPWSLGTYGIILLIDFFVQFTCSSFNRYSVNRIAARASGAASNTDNKKALHPDISVTVVGYREDEDAWRKCLRSLQQQTLRPRSLIAVVDGNEPADLVMADAFEREFQGQNAKVFNVPVLLSSLYQETYYKMLGAFGEVAPGRMTTVLRWLKSTRTPGEAVAHTVARNRVITEISTWEETYRISNYSAVCFVQPHVHKRTAMFTAFTVAMYGFHTKDAVFTTDSDTIQEPNALDEMYALLASSPDLGGVTADVKIWNRNDSFLALTCSIRYWFDFNVERGCQSFWGCVSCIAGPMGLYRTFDLDRIVGSWVLQRFSGKLTTFGEDRHLTNCLLSLGVNTRFTHRTFCQSESPIIFVRWVKQQTRWSRTFFREAFWFPPAFAYQSFWLTAETTKQALYPFILIATVLHFLYEPGNVFRSVAWLATMFAVAFIKSLFALVVTGDPRMLLFSLYGLFYFFGLLPSKVFALATMGNTTWGTSARSSGEISKVDNLMEHTSHVGHLVAWYIILSVGIAYFFNVYFKMPLLMHIAIMALFMSAPLYIDFGKVSGKIGFWNKVPKSSVESEPRNHTGNLQNESVTIPSTRVA